MQEPEAENGRSNSDDGQDTKPAAKPQEEATLQVNVQYIKDFSLEAPSAPAVFAKLQQKQPNIAVKVDVQARTINAPAYEVMLHVRADCKLDEEVVFITELTYAGIFTINVPENALRPVLLIECPRILFPFARQILANATMTGGFMPLMLAPVDFSQLYRQQLQREQAEKLQEDQSGNGIPDLDETSKLSV